MLRWSGSSQHHIGPYKTIQNHIKQYKIIYNNIRPYENHIKSHENHAKSYKNHIKSYRQDKIRRQPRPPRQYNQDFQEPPRPIQDVHLLTAPAVWLPACLVWTTAGLLVSISSNQRNPNYMKNHIKIQTIADFTCFLEVVEKYF